jgi:hypothetical protein
MSSYYKSWLGLTTLASKSTGNEKLGVGIRPYGLHAGNLASVVAYPYLFLENFEATQQKSARFTFQVWLNDIQPKTYVGADGRPETADWANMYPGSNSFQFMPAPNGFNGNLTDYWQPAIEGIVRGTIGERFPNVRLEFRRSSELISTPEFKKVVIGCIKNSEDVEGIIDKWNFNVAIVQGAASFVWPLHPETHAPLINPRLERTGSENLISVHDQKTGESIISRKPVTDLFWSVQFRMLQVARLAAIKPDIWFMGMDHVPTSMGNNNGILGSLAHRFRVVAFYGNFLHAPLLFAGKNKKLSKTLGDSIYMPIEELINALRGNVNAGLNVRFAPMSSDILSIGANFLPNHIIGDNQAARMASLDMEMEDYRRSNRFMAFQNNNAEGKVTVEKVAKMLGVPHL